MSLQSLVCRRFEGRENYVLVADRSIDCAANWAVQLCGAATFAGPNAMAPTSVEHIHTYIIDVYVYIDIDIK